MPPSPSWLCAVMSGRRILILGTHAQISSLIKNLKRQPFRLGQQRHHKGILELIDSETLQVIYCRF